MKPDITPSQLPYENLLNQILELLRELDGKIELILEHFDIRESR